MRRRTILIAGAIAGGTLLFVLAVAAVVALAFFGVSTREIREDERHLFVSVDQLAAYATVPGDRSRCESSIAKRNIDGSLELEYRYDTDKDPEAEDFLALTSEAELSDTVRLARTSFKDQVTAYKLGTMLVSGRSLKEDPSLFALGDDNFSAIVTQDGGAIGTVVVTRKGTIVHSLLIFGVCLDDRETLESLLEPTMR